MKQFWSSWVDFYISVMSLLDRNFEKLREQTTIFLPTTVYYVAHEVMSAIAVGFQVCF